MRIVNQRPDLGGALLLQKVKCRHDVGYLHAGIVDVVLNFDLVPQCAQHSHERVPENSIAEVSDVGGLVGVDVGVLDDDLVTGCLTLGLGFGLSRGVFQRCRVGTAVEAQIYVAGPRRLDGRNAGDGFQLGNNLFNDLARGRFSSLARAKPSGKATSPNSGFGGCSTDDIQPDRVAFLNVIAERRADAFFQS